MSRVICLFILCALAFIPATLTCAQSNKRFVNQESGVHTTFEPEWRRVVEQIGLKKSDGTLWLPPMMNYAHAYQFALAAADLDPKKDFYSENPAWRPQLGFFWITIFVDEPKYNQWLLTVNRFTGDVWRKGDCSMISGHAKLLIMQQQLRLKWQPDHHQIFDKLREIKPYFQGRNCPWGDEEHENPFDWPK